MTLPAQRQFSDAQYRANYQTISRSGFVEIIEEKIKNEHKGGQKRKIPVITFFIVALETVQHSHTGTLKEMYRIMTEEWSLTTQVNAGVRTWGSKKPNFGYHCMTRLFDKIAKAYDWHNIPDDEVAYALEAEFSKLLNDLILQAFPINIDWSGILATDGTFLDTFALYKPEAGSWDKDATIGHRTKTQQNKSDMGFGYNALAWVLCPKDDRPIPKLIAGWRLVTGNSQGISETVETLRSFGKPVTDLIADRIYSQAKLENFAQPIKALGIRFHLDLKSTDQGSKIDENSGSIITAGEAYCPGMPEPLHKIVPDEYLRRWVEKPTDSERERDLVRQHNEPLDKTDAQFAERECYRLGHNGSTAAGTPRRRCPAREGKVICAQYPPSLLWSPDDLPVVPNPPSGADLPKVCKQATVTVSEEALGKVAQHFVWQSPEWKKMYAKRTYVEGLNGQVKNLSLIGYERGWAKVVGHVKMWLLTALAVVALNMYLVRKWLIETGENLDPDITGVPPDVIFEPDAPSEEDEYWPPLRR